MPLSPPYQLEILTENDIDACFECAAPAFLHDALREATFPPHLVDPANPDEELDFRKRRMRTRFEDGSIFFKILDPDQPGRIAAWSNWTPPQKPDATKKTSDAPDPNDRPKCVNHVVLDAQMNFMKEAKERLFGDDKNFWYLGGLVTNPDYQGKGMGAALVRWGMEQAEMDGVPVYLEATPTGRILYTKLGFEKVDEFDVSKFLPDGKQYKMVCMIKRPGSKAQ
ncbi:hypothetical protein SLS56_007573 [Neofusicoccum ribis]|uniref:N-acetyltransferase domain-containing protein n=1 Tax=Neofusicoccum ribis TaxID=45134 RepID=A0ABR3SMN5_9PEZI